MTELLGAVQASNPSPEPLLTVVGTVAVAARGAIVPVVGVLGLCSVGAGNPAPPRIPVTSVRSPPYKAVIDTPGSVAAIWWATVLSTLDAVDASDGWTSSASVRPTRL